MAGYSGTPLPKKLGIKEGARLGLVDAPADFAGTLGELPAGVAVSSVESARAKRFDVIVAFVASESELRRVFARLPKRLQPAGGLWIAWRKRTAKPAPPLAEGPPVSEALVREVGLATGLVDNKVCAIDETWSGLRFVVRLADRR